MWRATEPVTPVYRLTVAASSTFSNAVRGTPGCGKTPKRVPVLTKPHDGSSMARPDMAQPIRSMAGAVAGRATDSVRGMAVSFGSGRGGCAGGLGCGAGDQCREAGAGLGPVALGVVPGYGERSGDHLARFGDRRELPGGDRLDGEVADRRRLHGASPDREASRARGQPAQQPVIRPAAHHVDRLDGMAGGPGELVDGDRQP